MSRDLEHLLNADAAEPSRPVDPTEIARLARKRRRRRHAGTAIAGAAATAGIVTAVALPLSSGANDTVAEPATDPAQEDVAPVTVGPDVAEPYDPDFDCPVTEPTGNGFIPPDGYPFRPSDQAHADLRVPDMNERVWYGNERLWTALPVHGNYGERKSKSVWWSTAFPGGSAEPEPEIDVNWQRIDIDAEPISNGGSGTNGVTAEDGRFMIAGIAPSEPGCWQVTAKYKGAEVGYVYEIPAE